MRNQHSYFLCTPILVLLLLSSITAALPASNVLNQPSAYSSIQSLIDPIERRHAFHPPVASFSTPHSSSHKRMYQFSPARMRVHMVHFQSFCAIVPVASAAKWLEEFYSKIGTLAATEWAQTPETDSFAIVLGHFRLSFNSLGDTIPWTFVREVVGMMWETSVRGFAELFEVIYQDEAKRVAVIIVLDLVDDNGSSSSGDGEFWREGSVPSVTSP